MNLSWCFTTLPILKWIEIIFSIIVLSLVEANIHMWRAYPFILFVGCFGLVVTFLLLLVYFTDLHRKTSNSIPWVRLEIFYDFLAAVLFAIVFGIAVYDTVMMFDGKWSHHDSSYARVGPREWKNRMAAISAFSGANAILFFLTAIMVRQNGI